MTNAFAVIVRYHAVPPGLPINVHDAEEMRERDRVERDSLEVLQSRLFIAEELEEVKIRERWVDAIRRLEASGDSGVFAREWGKMAHDIREIAKKVMT